MSKEKIVEILSKRFYEVQFFNDTLLFKDDPNEILFDDLIDTNNDLIKIGFKITAISNGEKTNLDGTWYSSMKLGPA